MIANACGSSKMEFNCELQANLPWGSFSFCPLCNSLVTWIPEIDSRIFSLMWDQRQQGYIHFHTKRQLKLKFRIVVAFRERVWGKGKNVKIDYVNRSYCDTQLIWSWGTRWGKNTQGINLAKHVQDIYETIYKTLGIKVPVPGISARNYLPSLAAKTTCRNLKASFA